MNPYGHTFTKNGRCSTCNITELEHSHRPRLCLADKPVKVELGSFSLTPLPDRKRQKKLRQLTLT